MEVCRFLNVVLVNFEVVTKRALVVYSKAITILGVFLVESVAVCHCKTLKVFRLTLLKRFVWKEKLCLK